MTNKERVHAALEGKPVDRMPVTVMYLSLYQQDHYAELTGRPEWERQKLTTSSPEEYVETYLRLIEKTPFDILQPEAASSRKYRENVEFVEREGEVFVRDKANDTLTPLAAPIGGHAQDYTPPHTQTVFDKADVDEQVKITSTEEMIADGMNDYLDAVVSAVGDKEFILGGGIIGAVYGCNEFVGMDNLYPMLLEQPDLVEYLSWKIVERNIETIRRYAAGGADAVWIDDATATSDMISVAHYERFSLPYMKAMIDEIHKVGLKVIVVYFGGVADRLEQIVATGADALAMETSMKGYVNDMGDTVAAIGDRITLLGNIDPVGVLEKGSDEELEAEIARQVDAGKRARGFIVSTGSPITPKTPLSRVQRFIELGRKYGGQG